MNGFSVTAILYGDHPDLAYRCLNSICRAVDPSLVRSLRIGLNQVCPDTRSLMNDVGDVLPASVEVLVYDAGRFNRLKYPLLRKMLYDEQHPVLTPFLMHFDDDSYLDEETTSEWWSDVYQLMQVNDMLGAVYRMPLQGDQARAIIRQPWYNGRPPDSKFRFATGGWWSARTRVLHKYDYPFPDLVHNGGDTILGELIRQQGLRLHSFRRGVRINADQDGNESKARRRGSSFKPLWYKYPVESSYPYHDFVVDAVDPRRQPIAPG